MIAPAHAWLAAAALLQQPEPTPVPLPYAHAHNDYVQERTLLDALEAGCMSVEADIVLVDGELYVAHERATVRQDLTLENAYLRPLAERVEQNGGTVHAAGGRRLQDRRHRRV